MKINLFYKKISKIVEKENPCGILLVGSLARMNELDFHKARDVDIFVIVDKIKFEREVINIDGLEFDVSYMSKKQLELSIEKRISSVICVLAKSKVLSSNDNTLEQYLEQIKLIYKEGPYKVDNYNNNYERFKLTQTYLTVKSRQEDYINFEFLSSIFVKDLLTAYFKLNELWLPPEKRMLKSIKDKELLEMIEKYYSNNDSKIENKLYNLENILDYILEPFGGKLRFWEKGEFPFDFK